MSNPALILRGLAIIDTAASLTVTRALGIGGRVDHADVSGSTCVDSAWYLNGTMSVIFEKGAQTYEYQIDDDMWDSFKKASSKGRWLHENVL